MNTKIMNRLVLPIAVIWALLVGCVVNPKAFQPVRGSGAVKTEMRTVSDFTQVTLNLVGKLYIERNGSESLSISSDDNVLPLIRSNVRNGMLTIDLDRATNLMQVNDLTYRITVKHLDELSVSGAAEVFVSSLDSESLAVTINGASKVTASGKAQRQTITIKGAGDYNAPKLESRIARVTHAGIGKAIVQVRDTLDVRIDGAGVIEYIGNPTVTKTINGIGTVRQIGQGP